jgi:hypothetical protein
VLPIAAFLVGSLLSLLLPTALLIALVVWYWWFVGRVPGPADPPEVNPPPTPARDASADPGRSTPPSAT